MFQLSKSDISFIEELHHLLEEHADLAAEFYASAGSYSTEQQASTTTHRE